MNIEDLEAIEMKQPPGLQFRNLRAEKRLTLRKFCKQIGADPGNWSRFERGIHGPPIDPEIIESIMFVLEISYFEYEDILKDSYVEALRTAAPALIKIAKAAKEYIDGYLDPNGLEFRLIESTDILKESLKELEELCLTQK